MQDTEHLNIFNRNNSNQNMFKIIPNIHNQSYYNYKGNYP